MKRRLNATTPRRAFKWFDGTGTRGGVPVVQLRGPIHGSRRKDVILDSNQGGCIAGFKLCPELSTGGIESERDGHQSRKGETHGTDTRLVDKESAV